MSSVHIFCLIIASLACVTDLNTRRIPNGLTFGAALLGFLYQFLSGGLDGFGHAALGWLVGALIFSVPFALRGLGGGDVKLLAALGAWLGWKMILPIVLGASVIGAIIGIIMKMSSSLREGRYVPFGPFLAGAGLVVVFAGPERVLGWLRWS